MRTYGQYCPIARGAEIFAERWTPLIIRNLHLGCETFGEILEGAPGLSHTLLAQRLQAARTPRHCRVGTQGSGARAPLPAHELWPRSVQGLPDPRRVGSSVARDRPREPRSIRGAVVDVQRASTGPTPGPARGHPVGLHRLPAPRAVLVADRARRGRDLQDVSRSGRGPLHHCRRRSVREVARRPVLLGGGNPRLPDPARRPVMARTCLPDLERPQHVRSHHARRWYRHRSN